MPKVSIIVLTYNSEKYIEKLLESIVKFNKDSNYEIIVVDNNSEDGTVRLIQNSKLPSTPLGTSKSQSANWRTKFKIIENKENVGFSRGINMGAREAKGEYLLFINPDAEWNSGSVNNFVSLFEGDDKIGVIGGKILTKDGSSEKSAGRFLKTSEVFLTTLGLDEALGVRFSPNKRCEVDFVSGGFMAVRRDLFERLGGFDENFFMYIEDMEFCFRVKKEELKVLFDPSIEVIHESHGSSNRSFAIENIYRGLLYFHKKHGTPFSYNSIKLLLQAKSSVLVLLGKIINNKYLTVTYSKLLRLKT
ncbi:MAG: hypothetical protein A2868_00955 [Candidatus Levybacteria bacterium RIFCSPHIGHO2_01_FULL_40_15b]|uniref:Glycosyltransferase 2-like domain-containing protein n=1 Tax=Candidatus Roizmanbacteria bacterium RIFCSPLOWO2_01_FULL_35_13 TaxID=1802055 RepID=A0A1F7I974_9BACT|nr:MAG: hypothetical protein A2868_00955 [Candidatus Levybacteria bacterium RIFCSPHIGHO2_01_FULL_40_15b]OGK39894.1 MAG: hypothetical protein A3A74_05415 [Candidatus Roizmanbacteria bacterium RIFCSPLOWO2_01_FULL_35_13]